MLNSTRRQFLASSAGVAALGLTGSLAFAPAAQAADLRKKGHYTYKIGDIEVTSIYDGIWENQLFDIISPGNPANVIKSNLKEAGHSDKFIPIEYAFTVVKTGGRIILIDAGTGDQLQPTAGLASRGGLEAAGISPRDVDMVLISHMHPDHIYGLMEKDTNARVYPNAEILVSETDYNYWTDASLLSTLPEFRRDLAKRIQATFPTWKNVSRFSGEKEVAPGVRAVKSFGHSPGHMSYHLSSGNDQLLLLGDAIIVPALFLRNLDWQLAFDADRDQASATRKAIVAQVIADDVMISGYHFGFPNSGKIKKDEGSHIFIPTTI